MPTKAMMKFQTLLAKRLQIKLSAYQFQVIWAKPKFKSNTIPFVHAFSSTNVRLSKDTRCSMFYDD